MITNAVKLGCDWKKFEKLYMDLKNVYEMKCAADKIQYEFDEEPLYDKFIARNVLNNISVECRVNQFTNVANGLIIEYVTEKEESKKD